jgi:phage shock protein C
MNARDYEPRRLHLSTKDKKIFGVCGGLAEYFGADATIIRLAWIIITILTGIVPGVVAYIVAAIVIPKDSKG